VRALGRASQERDGCLLPGDVVENRCHARQGTAR